MKTIALLILAVVGVGVASFGITAVLVGASATPANAGSVADHSEPRPVAAAATPASVPSAASALVASSLPAGAAVWRPEAEGLSRPLSPAEAPAYLERTAIVQLGLREGVLDRAMAIQFHAESGTLTAHFRLRPDPRQREFAQVLAQSIVSSVQALDLPIRVVQVAIADPADRPGLIAEVSLAAARDRPAASWEQSAAGTRAFLAWMAASPSGAAAERRVSLSGPWAR
jgi:hypothetical protein